MHGIHLTALLTTGVAVVLFGVLIHKLRLPANERLLGLAAVLHWLGNFPVLPTLALDQIEQRLKREIQK